MDGSDRAAAVRQQAVIKNESGKEMTSCILFIDVVVDRILSQSNNNQIGDEGSPLVLFGLLRLTTKNDLYDFICYDNFSFQMCNAAVEQLLDTLSELVSSYYYYTATEINFPTGTSNLYEIHISFLRSTLELSVGDP